MTMAMDRLSPAQVGVSGQCSVVAPLDLARRRAARAWKMEQRESISLAVWLRSKAHLGARLDARYCLIRQMELPFQPASWAAAQLVSLSLWQALQALGTPMLSVSAGVTK